MNDIEIQSKVNDLRGLRRMAEELDAEITAIQDAIKQHRSATNADELTGADYKITWKAVTSARIDTAALKKGDARRGRGVHQSQQHSTLCPGLPINNWHPTFFTECRFVWLFNVGFNGFNVFFQIQNSFFFWLPVFWELPLP